MALRTAALVTGFPFALLLLAMCFSMWKGLREAVRRGRPDHGRDNRALAAGGPLTYCQDTRRSRTRIQAPGRGRYLVSPGTHGCGRISRRGPEPPTGRDRGRGASMDAGGPMSEATNRPMNPTAAGVVR